MKAFSFYCKDLLELNFVFILGPYAGGGHYTSTSKVLNWRTLPPKSRKTADFLSHKPFRFSQTGGWAEVHGCVEERKGRRG